MCQSVKERLVSHKNKQWSSHHVLMNAGPTHNFTSAHETFPNLCCSAVVVVHLLLSSSPSHIGFLHVHAFQVDQSFLPEETNSAPFTAAWTAPARKQPRDFTTPRNLKVHQYLWKTATLWRMHYLRWSEATLLFHLLQKESALHVFINNKCAAQRVGNEEERT